jgi:hypothetical protein
MPAKGSLSLRADPSDPTRTLIVLNGQAVASVPWQQCDEIARSFTRAARAGEEHEKANEIVLADAALIRTGAPFSLTNNRRIRDAAYSAAQWDSHVRNGMPMASVPSQRRCGTPTVIRTRKIGVNGS